MPTKTKSYKDWLGAKLTDPNRAARYLNAARQDSPAMFFKALRKIAAAQSRPMTELAETVGVSRESLYRMMSETGNPSHENVSGILGAMGFKIEIVAVGNSEGVEGGTKHGEHLSRPATTLKLKRFSFGPVHGIAEHVAAYWSNTSRPSGNEVARLMPYAATMGNLVYAAESAISGNVASGLDLPDVSFVLAQQAVQSRSEHTQE